MADTNTIEKNKISVKRDLKEPPKFRVIYYNDDVTSFDFVITTLMEVFNYTVDQASDLAHQVHERGSSVVATLNYELAEQKTLEVLALAQLYKEHMKHMYPS